MKQIASPSLAMREQVKLAGWFWIILLIFVAVFLHWLLILIFLALWLLIELIVSWWAIRQLINVRR